MALIILFFHYRSELLNQKPQQVNQSIKRLRF